MLIRYSRWDGSQQLVDLDADDLLDGDVRRPAGRRRSRGARCSGCFQRGAQNPEGDQMPGLQDLLEQLRQRRQQQLERYDLGSSARGHQEEARDILKTEREGIERAAERRPRARARGRDRPSTSAAAGEAWPRRSRQQLDQLPEDPAGQIQRAARTTTSWTPTRASKFQELMTAAAAADAAALLRACSRRCRT